MGAKEDDSRGYLTGSRIGEIREDIEHATELPDRINFRMGLEFQVDNVRESLWRVLS